jgi:hypothetical protein
MNQAAADFIAQRLPKGLIHPGGDNTPPKPVMLPGLSSTGIPQEMLQHFAHEAGLPDHDAPKLIGEAIVHAIETQLDGGSEIISKAELAELRARATALDEMTTGQTVTIRTRCSTDTLLELTVGARITTLDCQHLRQRLADICGCD